MRDQLEHVVILLENRKLAMARDQLGATPLHKAVWFGHYKIAHYISHQFPETLNAIDMEGRTALHYAAALKDNKNMYGILIEAGANKGIFDNKGKTADYYAQYPEHLNLEEVIKRCHKVNANYLANTASRIKGKSPVRQSSPPSNGNSSSPRSDDNPSSKETSQSNDSGNENEMVSILQKEKLAKRLDMSSANIRRWVNAKDMDKLTKAVMEGYGDKVVRVNTTDDSEEKDQISGKITEMVERINAIHTAVSSDDLSELQNHLEEKDYALAKDHMG
ncbi:Inversin-B, partial [Stegodyphus mimosarum]